MGLKKQTGYYTLKLKQITMITTKIYRGIKVTMSYCPSNIGGTIDYYCHINGKIYRSPSWDNLKKAIRRRLLKDSSNGNIHTSNIQKKLI